MIHTKILQTYQLICSYIEQKRIKQSLDLLGVFLSDAHNGDLHEKKNELEQTYRHMLRFSIDGINDPEQEKVFNNLRVSLLKLAEEVKEAILIRNSSSFEYSQKRYLDYAGGINFERIKSEIEEYYLNAALPDLLEESLRLTDKDKEYALQHEKSREQFFALLWLTNHYTDAEKNLFLFITDSEIIEIEDKCLAVSALGLSLFRCFDPEKFSLLLHTCRHEKQELAQRALVMLLPLTLLYNPFLSQKSSLTLQMQLLLEDEEIKNRIFTIITQYIRSSDTAEIKRKLEEEIFPEMMKMKPFMEEKLNSDDSDDSKDEDNNGEDLDEKHPKWQEFLEKSGIADKLQEFGELQMEGADVYIGTFAMLKDFPFFNYIQNWFLPFYAKQPDVSPLFDSDKNKTTILSALVDSSTMCNSDKYSFCLSLMQMPKAQRKKMTVSFKEEAEQLSEIEKEEALLAQKESADILSNLYIQDLYRFYHLFPQRNNFISPFAATLALHKSSFFKQLDFGKDKIRQLAEYYFLKGHYLQALDLFSELDKDIEVYQKIGYCYQALDDYECALEYYLQADLIQINDKWTLRKIAFCYRSLADYENAIAYYQKVEELTPKNKSLLLQIGNCYLQLEQIEKAVAYYFKVHYLYPENMQVQRAIAWCSFLSKKYEQATKFYTQIIETAPSQEDFLNLGHVLLVEGQKKQAIENYQSALYLHEKKEEFFTAFEKDFPYLADAGIALQDLYFISDYLRLSEP